MGHLFNIHIHMIRSDVKDTHIDNKNGRQKV